MKKILLFSAFFIFVSTNNGLAAEKEASFFNFQNKNKENFYNLNNGKFEKIIPDGYSVVRSGAYNNLYPDYLLLQKDNKLYSYGIKSKKIYPIPLTLRRPVGLEYDDIYGHVSMSENNVFLISVLRMTKTPESDEYAAITSSQQDYIFNANTNKLYKFKLDFNIKNSNKEYLYDSKNQKLYFWEANSLDSKVLPLKVFDLKNKKLKTLVNFNDLNIKNNDGNQMSLKYEGGYFVVKSGKKIVTINASNNDKKIYIFSDESDKQLSGVGEYSLQYMSNKNIFLMGGANELAILTPNKQNIIDKVNIIEAEEAYINDVFYDSQNIYFVKQIIDKENSKNDVADLIKINLNNYNSKEEIKIDSGRVVVDYGDGSGYAMRGDYYFFKVK